MNGSDATSADETEPFLRAQMKKGEASFRQPRPFLGQEVAAYDHPSDDLGHTDPDFNFCPEAHDEALGSRRAADPKVATRPPSNE